MEAQVHSSYSSLINFLASSLTVTEDPDVEPQCSTPASVTPLSACMRYSKLTLDSDVQPVAPQAHFYTVLAAMEE